MGAKSWVWKSLLAGFSGMLVHFAFMYIKTRAGLLPSFQPYQNFQLFLSGLVGADVPAIVPWALSLVNGMGILGFLFGRVHRVLPGRNGAIKGMIFGLMGWVLMGVTFFPLIGLGPFAARARLGIAPAGMSLVMLMTYSVVLGTVYMALDGSNSET